MHAEMPRGNTNLEVYVDDMAFPSYVSSTAKERHHKFEEIGDCFIRELDWSRLTLKVREKGEKQGDGDKDKTLARLSGNSLDTLKQCLNNPTVLRMKDEDGRTSTVKISLKYIPVKMNLDPSESINNMGSLRVDVLDAESLPAADSNGKSDPYCKFELNGQELFKSKTQKKTLNPTWNESFDTQVTSRTAAKFVVKVFDYDFADKPDFLGSTDIDLTQLEPFRAKEVRLPLVGKKGEQAGSIRLRLLFRADYVTRQRMGTSTFGGTFGGPTRIMTSVVGVPTKGASSVVQGVGKGASFLKRGFKSKKDDSPNSSSSDIPAISTNGADASTPGIVLKRATGLSLGGGITGELTPPEDSPAPTNGGGGNGHSRTKSLGGSSMHSVLPPGVGAGTATFTVVSASGFPPSSDVYVVINQLTPKHKQVGKTKHYKSPTGTIKYDQTFKCKCTPNSTFQIRVKGEHTFGSDDDLGETAYYVDETGAGLAKEIKIGSGHVVIASTFTPDDEGLRVSDSPKSIRRSFLSKRESRSRDGTPDP